MNDAVQKSPQLILQKIYLKDASFESPMGIKAFRQEWKPKITQQLHARHHKIEENLYEVILITTLTAQLGEADKAETAFLVEVQQAGLFKLTTTNPNHEQQLLNAACPAILFPYLREAIDNLLVKAGFPAANLPPINFDALYQQTLQQKQVTAPAH